MRRFYLFSFLFVWLACTAVRAGELAHSGWQSLLDAQRHYDQNSIQSALASQWMLEKSPMVSKGFSRGQLWLKTDVTAVQSGRYTLEFANPLLEKIDLIILRPGQLPQVLHGGYKQLSASSWQTRYHNINFEFDLQAQESVRLLVMAEGTRALILWPRLTSSADFYQQGIIERFWIGIFTGVFLALSLYFLMVWRATKDRGLLEYVLFLSSNGLLQMHMLGVLHEYLLYPYPLLNDLCNALLPTLMFVSFLRFTHYFLDLDNYSPRSRRSIRICMWASWGLLPVYVLFGSRVSIPLAYALGPVAVWLGLSAGFVAWSRGYRPARFYMLAQAVLGIGGLMFTLIRFNLLPAVPLTVYSFQLASALEVIITALALADRINILQQERVKAQGERWAAERRMVEVLRESEALLEQRVKDRTLELEDALRLQCEQGEVLVKTNQKLTTLNEERSAFLGIAAHDLKNPTAAIMSYVDLINERWQIWDDENKRKRLGSIRALAQLIHEIIRNLLDVNAIEAGSYTLHPELLDPAEVCAQLQEEYRIAADRKHIELSLYAVEGVLVYMDRSALHQVLDNLVSNAIKYSPHGTQVSMSLSVENAQVVVRVKDAGPGISEEDQAKLYRKFTRLSARPTGGEHSTGLGLSIVKRIVEASGGTISCQSRLGEGATFSVALPLAPEAKPSQI